MSLKEFAIIQRYFKRAIADTTVAQSIGDDCALLSVPEGYQLAISMDTLVAGHHFPDSALPADIGRRAFCTCMSDLAAMGAKPRWLTLGLTLPTADEHWIAAFSQSLFALIDQYDCHLVGGDTTQGPLSITLQVHGFVKADCALTRGGAQVGDTVFVTGPLGDGAAALQVLFGQVDLDQADRHYLLERYYQPEPQIANGQKLIDCANSAIDISDGLLADLQHIANASCVDIVINTDQIPLSTACRRAAPDQYLALALTGGDDYHLAFTVPQKHRALIAQKVQNKTLQAIEIGSVSAASINVPMVRCYQQGRELTIDNQKGYQHFAFT